MRILATLAALGAIAIVLAPSPSSTKAKPGRTPVVFWHMWTGEWLPIVENICKRFNASQDKYEVIPLCVPEEGAASKFLLSVTGGSPPDLVSQWNPVFGMWTDRGLITPLENYMTPEEKASFLRDAYPAIKRHAIYQGKIYAMVTGIDLSACYFRVDQLKDAGIDPNHLPDTLEELVKLGRKLDRRDASGKLIRVGFLPQNILSYTASFGGGFNDPKTGRITLNSPQNIKALQFVIDTQKQLGLDNVTRFLASLNADTGMSAPLIAGNYSIILDGEWRVKQTAQFAPDLKYIIRPLPPAKGYGPLASYTAANLNMIPRGAKHGDGAWAFLKYWAGISNPEAGAESDISMGWLPFSPTVEHAKAYQDYLHKFPQYRVFVDLMSSPNLVIPPQGPLQAMAVDALTAADDSAAHGRLTPKDALDQAQAKVDAEEARRERLGFGK